MLQVTIDGSPLQDPGLDGIWSSIKSAASSAASAVSSAGSSVASGVSSGAHAVYDGAAAVAAKTCGLVSNPYMQTAAGIAATSGSPYAMTAGGAVKFANSVCGIAYPTPMPAPPIPMPGPNPLPPSYGGPGMVQYPQPAPAQAQQKIPAGSIAAFDAKRGGYRVAIPAGGLSGPRAAFMEVGVSATKPASAQLVDLKTFDTQTGTKSSWYKNPWVLSGIGVGVVALGGGAVLMSRRR